MKFDLNQHPEADDELTAAHDYYLKVSGSDLSDRFSDRIESAVDFVFQWPHAFPRFPIEYAPVTVRTYGLEEFPFSIVYAVGESEIFVLAYAHEKKTWLLEESVRKMKSTAPAVELGGCLLA